MRKLLTKTLRPGRSSTDACEWQIGFLRSIWSFEPRSTHFLASSQLDGRNWKEHPITGHCPEAIAGILKDYPAQRFNLYFCPNTFSNRSRKSANAMPTHYAWCDIDGASPDGYKPQPNILWETSPNRFQGIWIWKKRYSPEKAEQFSRNLWKIYGGDCSWSVTKLLRLPGTINHKCCYDQPEVKLIHLRRKPQKLPKLLSKTSNCNDWIEITDINLAKHDAAAVIKKYRRAVGLEVGLLITDRRVRRPDRSRRVFQVIAKLVEAGASDDEIGSVLSVNAYFVDKWGQDLTAMEDQIVRVRARVECEQ